ncbi:bifunctional serine/threonine-protein kinase/formylglycine-generating enzyme family protein [Allochromatium warmingii]|nr:bifunctional serine/threonine-protein kinase/formylglycine-generating enzyme family protein [Allochromatium warmingii]
MNIPGYTILRELGSGGMATVYLARQDRLKREVALKVMKQLATTGDDFVARFIKEGQIIAKLQHPQIVTIYDFDVTDGYYYFSMELLAGGTLAERIERGLTTQRALTILRRVAEALAVAHARGIIHRDIKPQNILFRDANTPVLTDFGIAHALTRDTDSLQLTLTRLGTVIGSPRYMSPEQSTGLPLDPRADLYSLGVVFYEMLTQELPYEADNVVSLAMKHCLEPIPYLSASLAQYQPLLDRLIAKKPDDRFPTVGALLRALDDFDGFTATSPPTDDATQIVSRLRPPVISSEHDATAVLTQASQTTPAPNCNDATEVITQIAAADHSSPSRRRWLAPLLIACGVAGSGGAYLALYGPPQFDDTPPSEPPSALPDALTALEESRRQASALLASGAIADSLAVIEQALRATPQDAVLLDLQATAQKQLQRDTQRESAALLDQAREAFNRADYAASRELVIRGLALAPNDPDWLAFQQRLNAQAQLPAAISSALNNCRERFPLTAIQPETAAEAQDCYTQILDLAPANPEVLAQLTAIHDQLATRITTQLTQHQLDIAEYTLAQLAGLAPHYSKLNALTAELSRRREWIPPLVDIRGGCFQMGSPASETGREDDERQHNVCVQPFRLGRFEVSVANFQHFITATGYQTDAERNTGGISGCWTFDKNATADPWGYHAWASWRKPNASRPNTERDPVSCISWNDAHAYLEWLNQETGSHFRFATEAEWEYAARADTKTARYWGDALNKQACRYTNSADAEHGWADGFPCNDQQEWVAPIGSFAPNALGLHDMLGNLWEWTCSEYESDYAGAEQRCTSPLSDTPRILRGGAWNSGPGAVRAAYRNRNFPESRYSFVGFRLAADTPASSEVNTPEQQP